MARKESDLVKLDNWQIDGLISLAHPSGEYLTGRTKGFLTAELTEAVRQEIAVIKGWDLSPAKKDDANDRKRLTDNRAAVKAFLEDEANADTVNTIRSRLRSEAQSQFDAGEYGKSERGPVSDPPRVTAVMPFIEGLYKARGVPLDVEGMGRNGRIAFVAKFESEYCDKGGKHKGKYAADVAKLVEGLAPLKTVEVAADL